MTDETNEQMPPTNEEPAAHELELYRTRVRDARLQRSDELIYNGSHSHAAVLIEELFLAADREIGILCQNLNPQVYGTPDVIAAAKSFMRRPGATLSIVSEAAVDTAHPLLRELAGVRGLGTSVRSAVRPKEYSGVSFNFMVADDNAYRFEKDATKPNATACFNDPRLARQMRQLIASMLPSNEREHADLETAGA